MIEQLINELGLFSDESFYGDASILWGEALPPGGINAADFSFAVSDATAVKNDALREWSKSMGFNIPDNAHIHSISIEIGDDEIVIWSEDEA